MPIAYPSLEAEVRIPENGILSRTLHNHDHAKAVIFGFSPGREPLAHTAPMAAPLNSVRGEANLTPGEDVQEVKAGASVHVPPQLQHGILWRTSVVMLPTMHKQARERKRQWPGNGPQSARCSVCARLIC
jgi:quercetin dioxygenase-like cupin family protein